MCFASKMVNKAFYETWCSTFEEASVSLVGRTERKERAIQIMENGLQFLGISAVEDDLQVI